jgi:hypothetical protein
MKYGRLWCVGILYSTKAPGGNVCTASGETWESCVKCGIDWTPAGADGEPALHPAIAVAAATIQQAIQRLAICLGIVTSFRENAISHVLMPTGL